MKNSRKPSVIITSCSHDSGFVLAESHRVGVGFMWPGLSRGGIEGQRAVTW